MKPAHLLAAVLIAVAFVQATALQRGLTWPAFDIQYREMAAAQTLLDGAPGGDPCYRDESAWYNPMSGWILAAASRVSHAPVAKVILALGPWINLLAPIGFYLLVAALLGPWTAVAALAAFLFLSGDAYPYFDAATYTPYFAPEGYGQGLFYLALLRVHRAEEAGASRAEPFVQGVLLGLLFLVHTTPAVLLGGVLAFLAARRAMSREAGEARAALGRLAVALATALVVSLPIAVSVVGRYRLHAVNPFPAVSPNPIFGSLKELVSTLGLGTPLVIAVVAIGVRLRRGAGEPPVFRAWLVVTLAGLAWSAANVLAHRLAWGWVPQTPVPGFHFLFYAMALVSAGFGVAVWDLSGWAARRLASWRAVPRAILAAAVVVATVAAALPAYSRRPDATTTLEEARELQAAMPAGLYAWMRAEAHPGDVVLCTDAESLFVVAPAGRKVVATNRYFSNPFVDWSSRDHDRNAMYDALHAGDLAAYDALAARYRVSWIVVPHGLDETLRRLAGIPPSAVPALTPDELERRPGFDRVFEDARYSVYRRSRAPESFRPSVASSVPSSP